MVNKKLNQRKGQSFSTDILVVVIIILFGGLFLVLSQLDNVQEGPSTEEKYEVASFDADLIVNKLKADDVISTENEVNIELLMTLDRESIANDLGIKNDFCIVFEKDGKLVKIDPESNVNGVGSENIIVNGVPCK